MTSRGELKLTFCVRELKLTFCVGERKLTFCSVISITFISDILINLYVKIYHTLYGIKAVFVYSMSDVICLTYLLALKSFTRNILEAKV